MELNAREIAVVIWTLLFVGWGVSKAEVRRSAGAVLRTAANWKIALPVALMAAYTVAVVWGLHALDFWDWDLLKKTVLWFFVSSFSLAYKAVVKSEEHSFWRSAVVDQIKITVVLAYLANTYTFPLWGELLLVPVLAFVAMLDVVAKSDEQYAVVARMTEGVMAIYGLVLLGLAVQNAVANFGSQEVGLVIRSLALVPILALALTPLLFVFQVLEAYEQLWLRLRLGRDKDARLVRYAKWRLVRHLRFRPRRAKAFLREHALDLMRLASRAEIDQMIQESPRHRRALSS